MIYLPDYTNADGITDDYQNIINVLTTAASLVQSTGRAQVIDWGDKTYYSSRGIPISTYLIYRMDGKRGGKLIVGGNEAGIYSATYSNGIFTDNLNATVSEVASKTKACHNSGLIDFHLDYIGQISGIAPSGISWKAGIQLVGFFDGILDQVRVDHNCANYDGIFARLSWRIRLENPITSRGSSVSGGRGIHIGDQCHAFSVNNPSSLGTWDIAIAIDSGTDKINGGTLINVNAETANIGLLIAGTGINVLGGYIENCKTDLALGVVNGAPAYKPRVVGVFHGTSSNSEYYCRLNNTSHFWLDPVYQTNPTYSLGKFKYESQANLNYCFFHNERFVISDVELLSSATNAPLHIYSDVTTVALNRKGSNNPGDLMNFFLAGNEEGYLTVNTNGVSLINK